MAESTRDPGVIVVIVSDPGYAALRTLWDLKRGSRRFPAWTDFAADELKPYWPNAIVLDVLADRETFRYRHFGSVLMALFNQDFTGLTTKDLPLTNQQGIERDYARALQGDPLSVTNERRLEGVRYRNVQKLILPMGESSETVDTLLVLLGVDPVRLGT